ncbi:OmpA family protein [Shewanella surugensis]|uniref:OmpA family protein n=1 Tax=Shewanella surugensis TaxID=212020 RepID=UPI0035E1C215
MLSEQRALSIKHLLMAYGVPAARIDCSAQGESYPVATNSTKRGRQKNRRVSVTFIQN